MPCAFSHMQDSRQERSSLPSRWYPPRASHKNYWNPRMKVLLSRARRRRVMICVCECAAPAFDRKASKKRARWGNFSNCSERIVLSPLRENSARRTPRRKHSENMRRRVIQLDRPFRMQPVYYSPSLIPATEIIIRAVFSLSLDGAWCARRCDIEILG